MGTTDTILSLLVLGGVGYVAYNMMQEGKLPNIFAQMAPTTTTTTAPVQEEEYPATLPPEDLAYQTAGAEGYYPPEQQMPQVVPPITTYPQQQQPQYPLAGPPGSTSSLYYMQTPSGPPYISQTVGTYSQYSPYNQFYQYSQQWTQPWGAISSMPDDNTNFTDIRTDTSQCEYCKRACKRSKYGYTCRACRPSCKQYTHQYLAPKQYWDITPAGGGPTQLGYQPISYSPYYPQRAYLAMVYDRIMGKPTFLEMDNYHGKRKFDPHNKLKRRIRPRTDHSFVSQEDYWNNAPRINFNLE